MIPFRVYNQKTKEMWVVLNYHSSTQGEGSYLLAKEDEGEDDGVLKLTPVQEMTQYLLVDFLGDEDDFAG